MTARHTGWILRAALAVLLAAPFMATAAGAPPLVVPCGEHAAVLAGMAKRHGEVPVARGLDAAGNLVEVLAAPGGSFTVLSVTPEGIACLMSVGEGWQTVAPKAAEKGRGT